jgi:hypothetical protein
LNDLDDVHIFILWYIKFNRRLPQTLLDRIYKIYRIA